MIKVIIHKYDDEPDMNALAEFGCSEVFHPSRQGDDFEYVIGIPTKDDKINKAVIADAISRQYKVTGPKPWPGHPDRYRRGVEVTNVRYTTKELIINALIYDNNCVGQWHVKTAELPAYVVDNDEMIYAKLKPNKEQGSVNIEPLAIEDQIKKATYYTRGRNRTIRNYVINDSNGVCEVCNVDCSKALCGQSRHVLQVHHHQLAYNDAPVVTRSSDIAVLCANCYTLIHTYPKHALSVVESRSLLN